MARRSLEDLLTLTDAAGRAHPPRRVALALADTIVRTVAVIGILLLIALIWNVYR